MQPDIWSRRFKVNQSPEDKSDTHTDNDLDSATVFIQRENKDSHMLPLA